MGLLKSNSTLFVGVANQPTKVCPSFSGVQSAALPPSVTSSVFRTVSPSMYSTVNFASSGVLPQPANSDNAIAATSVKTIHFDFFMFGSSVLHLLNRFSIFSIGSEKSNVNTIWRSK